MDMSKFHLICCEYNYIIGYEADTTKVFKFNNSQFFLLVSQYRNIENMIRKVFTFKEGAEIITFAYCSYLNKNKDGTYSEESPRSVSLMLIGLSNPIEYHVFESFMVKSTIFNETCDMFKVVSSLSYEDYLKMLMLLKSGSDPYGYRIQKANSYRDSFVDVCPCLDFKSCVEFSPSNVDPMMLPSKTDSIRVYSANRHVDDYFRWLRYSQLSMEIDINGDYVYSNPRLPIEMCGILGSHRNHYCASKDVPGDVCKKKGKKTATSYVDCLFFKIGAVGLFHQSFPYCHTFLIHCATMTSFTAISDRRSHRTNASLEVLRYRYREAHIASVKRCIETYIPSAKCSARNWQKVITDMAGDGYPTNSRVVYWVADPIGESGKTVLKDVFNKRSECMYISNYVAKDFIDTVIKGCINEGEPKVILIDIARAGGNVITSNDLYVSLETILSGEISTGKYAGNRFRFNKVPHVVVLSNNFPVASKLTTGRWVVITITPDRNDIERTYSGSDYVKLTRSAEFPTKEYVYRTLCPIDALGALRDKDRKTLFTRENLIALWKKGKNLSVVITFRSETLPVKPDLDNFPVGSNIVELPDGRFILSIPKSISSDIVDLPEDQYEFVKNSPIYNTANVDIDMRRVGLLIKDLDRAKLGLPIIYTTSSNEKGSSKEVISGSDSDCDEYCLGACPGRCVNGCCGKYGKRECMLGRNIDIVLP